MNMGVGRLCGNILGVVRVMGGVVRAMGGFVRLAACSTDNQEILLRITSFTGFAPP